MKQERLPGINPQGVEGCVLRPTDDTQFYVVPSRGMDVLEARVADQSVLWAHPSGHLQHPCGDLDHIEGFFTAGIENTGPPAMGLPLHGSFGWRSADAVEFIDTETEVGVRGVVHATDMVRGPYIDVTRTITAPRGRRAFKITDRFDATVDSEFMLLYHPNFPVRDGHELYVNALAVKSRDPLSDFGLEQFREFSSVGTGRAVLPPGPESSAAAEENFEQAYLMHLVPDTQGFVTAMLVAEDKNSAAVVRYGGDGFDAHQQCFVQWKNPRGGVCGMERGSTFCGREWAKEHDLVSELRVGQPRTYEVEVEFLNERDSVDQAIDYFGFGENNPELIPSNSSLPDFYRSNGASQ